MKVPFISLMKWRRLGSWRMLRSTSTHHKGSARSTSLLELAVKEGATSLLTGVPTTATPFTGSSSNWWKSWTRKMVGGERRPFFFWTMQPITGVSSSSESTRPWRCQSCSSGLTSSSLHRWRSSSLSLRGRTWTRRGTWCPQGKIIYLLINYLRERTLELLKALALEIRGLDLSWMKECFIHSLTSALNALALKRIWKEKEMGWGRTI